MENSSIITGVSQPGLSGRLQVEKEPSINTNVSFLGFQPKEVASADDRGALQTLIRDPGSHVDSKPLTFDRLDNPVKLYEEAPHVVGWTRATTSTGNEAFTADLRCTDGTTIYGVNLQTLNSEDHARSSGAVEHGRGSMTSPRVTMLIGAATDLTNTVSKCTVSLTSESDWHRLQRTRNGQRPVGWSVHIDSDTRDVPGQPSLCEFDVTLRRDRLFGAEEADLSEDK